MRFRIGCAAVAIVSLLVTACGGNPLKGTIENHLTKYLAKHGYTIWVMPSTLGSAGALITYDDRGRPEIQGDLKTCGVSDDVLFGPTDEARKEYRDARFPEIDLTGENDFGLGLAIGVKAIGGSFDFSRIRKMTVSTTKAGPETLQGILVRGFLNNPENLESLLEGCATAIQSGDVKIIFVAAYIEGGEITFFGKDDFSAKLDKAAVISALNLDPSVHNKVTREGKLTFNERIYIGFLEARQPLGSVALGSSDSAWRDVTEELAEAVGREK